MDSIIKLSANKIIQLIKNKEVTSVEVTKTFLQKITEVNPKLNAVIDLNEDLALKQAANADKKIQSDNNLGLLHGLPITVKDTIDIFGYKNCYGSNLYKNYMAKQEGTCVKRLREAGAVILGLTNSPELLTAYESDNLIFGKTNNPYDLNRTSGGSSGGEAAIIAANGSPFGLGTDGGGSIRVPAHYCGIAGIKPTQGLIPLTGINLPGGGAGALQAFGTCGPMAKYIDDIILGLNVLSGPDGIDPGAAAPVNIGNPNNIDIKNLKIAYFTDNGIVTPSKDIINAVLDAVSIFADSGAAVIEDRPENIERTFELHWEPFFTMCDGGQTVSKPFNNLKNDEISSLRKQFNYDAKTYNLTAAQLNERFAEIAAFRWSTYSFLNKYDLIICPPCATTAKLHGQCLNEIKDFTYTMTFNNTGSPAVVVPFSKSIDGLPIGIQIVANLWKDHVALAAAKYLEAALSG